MKQFIFKGQIEDGKKSLAVCLLFKKEKLVWKYFSIAYRLDAFKGMAGETKVSLLADKKLNAYFLPFPFRWNLLRKLQPHREMSALHRMHRSIPHEGALHRLKWRHLCVQLWLLFEHIVREVWTLHQMSWRPRHAVQLRVWPRHGVWGVQRWHLLGPGKFSGALHPLHHLWRGGNVKALHLSHWYSLSR